MKKLILLFFLLYSSTHFLDAQKAPIKYGKVDISDLEMQSYTPDTSAPAVILCQYGYFDSRHFEFRYLIRIKILKKEGLFWANHIFPMPENTTIRGITFNLENGVVVETKLKKESIFKEKVYEDNYRYRVAMPNVIVGSVLDIDFRYVGFPYEWKFQETIPVKWSELIIESSPYITFRKNLYGYQKLDVSTDRRWVAKDMPAFKEEAYTNSVENYITKFEFDILYAGLLPYTTTWEAVRVLLEKSDHFGKTMEGNLFLNPIAKAIETKYSTDMDKMKAAFDTLKSIKWNEFENLFTTTPNLSYAYNKRIGNSADINLMLVSLLNKLGINSYPLLMSTREHGVIPFYPTLFKLNYVIAYAKIGNDIYTLDATEELLPFYLLPERALNNQGKLLLENHDISVDLKPKGKDRKLESYDLQLTENNSLTGSVKVIRYDYNAFNFRTKYKEFNSRDEYIENIENENGGSVIDKYVLYNQDSIYLPIRETYNIEFKNAVQSIADRLYITPLLYEKINENPFKIEERQYPVDFPYLTDLTYSYVYNIPDNYEIIELPSSVVVKLPENAASMLYNISKTTDVVSVTCKISINKNIFLSNEYSKIKEFYNQIIKKEAEPIVLRKIVYE
jgi:hypothetical protein